MKISQLISVLDDIKKEYGDQYIWSIHDLDFPCPKSFEIELTKKLKKSSMGYTGGKSGEGSRAEILLEYEGGVNLQDRSIWDQEA